MDKLKTFQHLVKANRRKLIKEHGFNAATVWTWEHGKRVPIFETASKLAVLLGVSIDKIPYHRVERSV